MKQVELTLYQWLTKLSKQGEIRSVTNLDLYRNNVVLDNQGIDLLKSIKTIEHLPSTLVGINNERKQFSLEELLLFPKLKYFDGNSMHTTIEDLTKLESLRDLQVLLLPKVELQRLDGIENFPNLQFLDLKQNKLKNIEPLIDCKNLRILDIGRNYIQNINIIFEIATLRRVYIGGNPINDLSWWTEEFKSSGTGAHVIKIRNKINRKWITVHIRAGGYYRKDATLLHELLDTKIQKRLSFSEMMNTIEI